jgi:DNA replication protein DnaC
MTSSWEKRFPNKHTRPDLDDPLTSKARCDSKKLFGHDPLETAVSTVDYIADLRRKWETPEYQEHVATQEREQADLEARQADMEYHKRLESLSLIHVRAVQAGCTPELNPITTTEIQRKVIASWDGVKSMFLLGETGVGKTYTATWCAMRAAKAGRDVMSTTATKVAQMSLEGLIRLRGTGLLILDQLHTLRSPSGKDMPAWQVAPVIDLIDHRYEQELTTIAAGTRAPEDMFDILGDDVRRRFPVRLSSESTVVDKGR